MNVRQMSPQLLKQRLDNGDDLYILDVREPYEWEVSNLGHYKAVLIPKRNVLQRIAELDRNQEIVVQCRSGSRSAVVIRALIPLGFNKLWNLEGGINRWAREIDPKITVY